MVLHFVTVFLTIMILLNYITIEAFSQKAVLPSELYACSAVLMDAESGRILFSKNGDEKMPMASTTKIMTCIIALEYSDPQEQFTVSELAASQPRLKLGSMVGQQLLVLLERQVTVMWVLRKEVIAHSLCLYRFVNGRTIKVINGLTVKNI